MKFLFINCSPRGSGGNTKILLDWLTAGIEISENKIDIIYLNRIKFPDSIIDLIFDSETTVLAMPLYTDCMPGQVKALIESFAPYRSDRRFPALGFVVLSGFPESIHSRALEQYFQNLTRLLNCEYAGTLIRGGGEILKTMPIWMSARLRRKLSETGRKLSETGKFDSELSRSVMLPEHIPNWRKIMYRTMKAIGIADKIWNSGMKENRCFSERLSRPYQEVEK